MKSKDDIIQALISSKVEFINPNTYLGVDTIFGLGYCPIAIKINEDIYPCSLMKLGDYICGTIYSEEEKKHESKFLGIRIEWGRIYDKENKRWELSSFDKEILECIGKHGAYGTDFEGALKELGLKKETRTMYIPTPKI